MTTTNELILPLIHNNGTARCDLLEQYLTAKRKLNEALNAIRNAEPHDRDYYISNDPQAGHKARQQHADRQLRLMALIAEFEILAEAVV